MGCFKQVWRSDDSGLISTSHSFGISQFGMIDGKADGGHGRENKWSLELQDAYLTFFMVVARLGASITRSQKSYFSNCSFQIDS
jgi:hypothetical protein